MGQLEISLKDGRQQQKERANGIHRQIELARLRRQSAAPLLPRSSKPNKCEIFGQIHRDRLKDATSPIAKS